MRGSESLVAGTEDSRRVPQTSGQRLRAVGAALLRRHLATVTGSFKALRPGLVALPLICTGCGNDSAELPSPESVDIARQAVLVDGRAPVTAAQQAADHLAALRARMDRPVPSALQTRYAQCSSSTSAREDCLEPLSDLLQTTFTRHVIPYLGEHKEVLRPLVVNPGYRTHLERTYVQSDDDRTRIAALALLRAVSTDAYRALPAAAYEDLETKTHPELALLLDLHTHVPLPTESARQAVFRLARDRATRGAIRVRAVRALARPRNAEAIGDLARSEIAVAATEGSALIPEALPRALGMCGRACDQLLLELYADEGLPHELALRALSRVADRQLVEQILATDGQTWETAEDEIMDLMVKPFIAPGGGAQ